MKKAEAEAGIHKLFGMWAKEKNIQFPYSQQLLSAYDFIRWVQDGPYSDYLEFRSEGGPLNCVERWFDTYFGQNWRN